MKLVGLAVLLVAGASAADPVVTVHFSPRGGCTDDVVALVRSARRTVRQAAYAYTSLPVADALRERARAGVDVQVVVDDSYADHPVPQRLRAGGAVVWSDSRHAIMHSKYLVVDGAVVETGSFNYTGAAETGNAENCLVVRDATVARAFSDDWERHRAHSKRM